MDKEIPISAIILAKNEADIILRCISSLGFADSIIVGVDTATTDNTRESISKLKDSRIKILDIDVRQGFAKAKNQLIDTCEPGLCLLIDADETVNEDLAQEITDLKHLPPAYSAFAIEFDTLLLGKEMHHGGWQETHVRLFDPHRARYSGKPVHEELIVNGNTGKLKGRITHNTHRTINSLLNKINLYSGFEAEHIVGYYDKKITRRKMFYEGSRHFAARYIIRKGFLDGTEGFIEAVAQAFSIYIQWAKAWELQKKSSDRALDQGAKRNNS